MRMFLATLATILFFSSAASAQQQTEEPAFPSDYSLWDDSLPASRCGTATSSLIEITYTKEQNGDRRLWTEGFLQGRNIGLIDVRIKNGTEKPYINVAWLKVEERWILFDFTQGSQIRARYAETLAKLIKQQLGSVEGAALAVRCTLDLLIPPNEKPRTGSGKRMKA